MPAGEQARRIAVDLDAAVGVVGFTVAEFIHLQQILAGVPVRSACPPGSAPCEKQDLAGLDFGGAAEQGSKGGCDRRGEAAALRESLGRY